MTTTTTSLHHHDGGAATEGNGHQIRPVSDQLEDACQISKHALAILPSEKEKKEIDAELVRRSYDSRRPRPPGARPRTMH